ncbi:DUF397 domain-containing protein [Streptantibioticus ferralitis]|uniref:DUF397 domain-containing protein n=1 Tax=Streptantibioticus ferralitis TaxID=236510 RepID=A0ABT5Z0B0_9ACTN|nr:DUF397 domain-containing protein [Streptantibioticus ferralitis]MDF2257203.1 DUF397 domain-containing protein [Streptantibioticus ferralitis]
MTQESAPRTTENELEGAFWHTSSYSGTNNNCVERGKLRSGRQAVRDTKDRERGALIFDADVWRNFVAAVRNDTL